jgi:type I restriction enzyme S subunit
MCDGGTVIRTKETISEKAKVKVFSAEPVAAGAVIMSFTLTIGKISRLGVPAFHNEAIISIRPYLQELEDYLFKVLPQFARMANSKDAIKGATPSRGSIGGISIPLPPLNEQRRIVAKANELMALCDRLEAAQCKRENGRERLTTAIHHRLKNGEDAESFAAMPNTSSTIFRA